MAKLKPNQFQLHSGALITEHPILFQTEMVQAILENQKTQTRRTRGFTNEKPDIWQICNVGDTKIDDNKYKIFGAIAQHKIYQNQVVFVKSPYGKPCDLLWVKETWCNFPSKGICYKTQSSCDPLGWEVTMKEKGIKWKPSIHMPKSGSRIWLMIEDILVERVQDIIETDARAEGVLFQEGVEKFNCCWYDYEAKLPCLTNPKSSFKTLWKSINGEASWIANPWVWVIKFRVLSKTGKPSLDLIEKNYSEILSGSAPLRETRKEADHV